MAKNQAASEPHEIAAGCKPMPIYEAVILNENGEEERREIAAASDGEAVREARKLRVPCVLEREGRVVAEF